MKQINDLTGRRFGRLVVLSRIYGEENHLTYWRVRCDCGEEFSVARPNLVSGATRSCGCLRRERVINYNHGRAKR